MRMLLSTKVLLQAGKRELPLLAVSLWGICPQGCLLHAGFMK